jgi:hypothetical protein
MKLKDNLHYIRQDRWKSFLESYSAFGYNHEGGFAYPDFVYKDFDDGCRIKINISESCINVWDCEDKNSQREVLVWKDSVGHGCKERTAPYVQDLIEAGYIK